MIALTLVLATGIGVTLGLLGGGGSILTTPLLVYVQGMPPDAAIATSLVVVGVTSAAATVQHARRGNVRWRTGLAFGGAGMVGAYLGGRASAAVPSNVLMGLFTALMGVTALAMLRGRAEVAPRAEASAVRIAAQGAAVGALTGLLGAGGGFIVVPALVLAGGLPMPAAIGTSLLVITLNTLAGFLGHLGHVAVDAAVAVQVSAAAVAGSLLGSRLSGRVRPDALRRAFGVLVLAMTAFVVYAQLHAAHPR